MAASTELHQLIAATIRQEGDSGNHPGSSGPSISFARYMELALYAPNLGYYSGGATKLGQDGDFTTAPEISPLFGQTLAHVSQALIPDTGHGLQILELGAGSGKLALDFLHECRHAALPVAQYAILDISGSLRARQRAMLHEFPEVCWLDQLPARFSGVILANEVLDAMPVHLVRKDDSGWQELRVGLDQDAHFVWQAEAADTALLGSIARQIPDPDSLPPGYTTEVHPVASGFIHSLANSMQGPAAAILIDYGFPAHEFYLNQRTRGTLHCHYRHHAHDDPFFWPGLQDITAHVDFSDIARTASEAGLDGLHYSSQAAFLQASGITDLLLRTDPGEPSRYLPQANALQRLLSPAEMGELFKVMILGRECVLPAVYQRYNRLDRLG